MSLRRLLIAFDKNSNNITWYQVKKELLESSSSFFIYLFLSRPGFLLINSFQLFTPLPTFNF